MNQPANSPCIEARIEAVWPASQWCAVNVVVAVSGGADSMALLRALRTIKDRRLGDGKLFAGHVNHRLRGQQSDEDQAWLENQCQSLDTPLLCASGDAAAAASGDGDGMEAAARKVRYQLLAEMAESVGGRFVATGHHRDDQVETVLFRMFRGAGLRGLGGIRSFRPLTPSVSLVRPLLDCTRDELRSYLTVIGQAFRHDPSNDDVTIKRNRLRREILPLLREQFNPDVDAAIRRSCNQLAAAGEVVDRRVRELAEQCRFETSGDCSASVVMAPLAEQGEFLAIEVIRFVWREAGLPEQGMAERHWKLLCELVGDRSRPRLQLPGGVQAWVADERLVVKGDDDRTDRPDPSD